MRSLKRSRQNKTRKTKNTRTTRTTRKGGAFSRMFRKTKVHPNITLHDNPLHNSLSPKSSRSKSSRSKSPSKSKSLTNASLSNSLKSPKSLKSPIKMYYTFNSYTFDVVYKPDPQNINNVLTFRCKNIPSEIRKKIIDEMNEFKHIPGHNQKYDHDQYIVVSISNYKESILVQLGQIPSFKIEDGKLIFDKKYQQIGDNFSGTFSYNNNSK